MKKRVNGRALFAWAGLKDENVELLATVLERRSFDRVFILFKDSPKERRPKAVAEKAAEKLGARVHEQSLHLVPVGGADVSWNIFDEAACRAPIRTVLDSVGFRRLGVPIGGDLEVFDETGTQAQRLATRTVLTEVFPGAAVRWFDWPSAPSSTSTITTTATLSPLWSEQRELERCKALLKEQIVLVTGPTGVGKSQLARKIARAWGFGDDRFHRLNCAGLSAELADRELFGHEKGAFTGADKRTLGLFAAADGGVLFLDEVGELEPSVQAKLLLALGNGDVDDDPLRTFRPLGSTKTLTSRVRVICATNRRLWGGDRRLRDDLLARIADHEIEIPPLAAQGAQDRILASYTRRLQQHGVRLDDGARDALAAFVRAKQAWAFNWRDVDSSGKRLVTAARMRSQPDLEEAGTAEGREARRGASGASPVLLKDDVDDMIAHLTARWKRADAQAAREDDGILGADEVKHLTVPDQLVARRCASALRSTGGNRARAWERLAADRIVDGGKGNPSQAMNQLLKQLKLPSLIERIERTKGR